MRVAGHSYCAAVALRIAQTRLLPILARTPPQATLQALPRMGHMVPVTHPHVVHRLIAAFLCRQARGPHGLPAQGAGAS